jgi:hypothetical protein
MHSKATTMEHQDLKLIMLQILMGVKMVSHMKEAII